MMRIACIDDDAIFVSALAQKMEAQQVLLTHFYTVTDFLKSEDCQRFSAVLVDLDMEDADGVTWKFAGLQAIKTIRAAFKDGMPLYVLTGQRNDYLISSSGANGADGYIEKSYLVEDVAQRVMEYLPADGEGRASDIASHA